ncbi:deoxyribodipyrimidine photo-lyase [Pseudomonas lalucatii]|uniref:Deoxyribodipyrimidine photo-lyase n=1 Tax=Pseudomonas lalucatii TaxID=1424203 RepID=A0ABS5PZH9_9PSED|nr:deoxyribodipyrimidine photo-lyase [Pseudomonas lalucatii]MBS7661897.1 deoxyribodipyrimidine photo-lyase [Pseudomonas lalucatii]MBS7726223.1 deoxyribodipyrimidine photo-lyase [Pseudomonas lalucatii]QVM88836.1 deoxyribodipyrimidine photo-lyase [Pseudomonas lalucatii]
MQLIWLRSDLRVRDNSALAAAMAAGPTVALYLLSPEQWRRHDAAPCKVDFWRRNLVELSAALARLNVPLLIRQADSWDAAPGVIAELCREQRIAAVWVNDEYGIDEQRRDQAVARHLDGQGVTFQRRLDQLLLQPGSVLTQSGSYFKVYSQFRKLCHQRLHRALPTLLSVPAAQTPLALAGDTVPAAVAGFTAPGETLRRLWPAGETAALERLASFADERIDHYHEARDIPAQPGTSQLSAYLAAGVLSPRQCLHAALQANQGEFDSGNQGIVTWINELLWREFYKHILVGYPRVSRHRAFRPETEAVPWRDAPDELAAWQEGRTGIPLIDAAMRQLHATGWMHNRLRMVVAMFLTKNLLIDWRAGERYFMRQLIDGDLAANNGGWQWSASTGTDAAPYFRLFNPVSQSRRFDPQGRFIRHWLPELAGLDDKAIHEPSAARGGLFDEPDYPRPLVDLRLSRERALAAFRQLPQNQARATS